MGPHSTLLLPIYVLYFNVTYISCIMSCGNKIVSKLKLFHFNSKQTREAVDLPLTCHPSPSLTTFALMSSDVRRLMFHLDPYGDTDLLGMFQPFHKMTALAPCISAVFLRLVRLGSFQACWRQVNVTPIPKGPPSFSVANYRSISIT